MVPPGKSWAALSAVSVCALTGVVGPVIEPTGQEPPPVVTVSWIPPPQALPVELSVRLST